MNDFPFIRITSTLNKFEYIRVDTIKLVEQIDYRENEEDDGTKFEGSKIWFFDHNKTTTTCKDKVEDIMKKVRQYYNLFPSEKKHSSRFDLLDIREKE